MSKNTDKIKEKIRRLERIKVDYITSSDFAAIADRALVNFIKRVKRGLMPDLSAIPGFTSESYVKRRKQFSFQLGELGKPNKSNATATGQMLEAMAKEITATGFKLIVQSTGRVGELGDGKSRHTNKRIAEYYSMKREIFEFSKPELERMIREVKRDLLKLIREATKGS
jgi:hypothetical protein